MRVKFLKPGRWAHPTNVRFPQIQVEAGDVHDVPDELGQTAIGAGAAERVDADEPEAEPEAKSDGKDPKAEAKHRRDRARGSAELE